MFNLKETLRFLVGGGSAVAMDYLAYNLLLFLGLPVPVAKGVSFVAGSIVGFVINKLWTFNARGFSGWEVMRYAALYTVTLTLNMLVNSLVLGAGGHSLLAYLCATGVSTVLNFLGQKLFVFRNTMGSVCHE